MSQVVETLIIIFPFVPDSSFPVNASARLLSLVSVCRSCELLRRQNLGFLRSAASLQPLAEALNVRIESLTPAPGPPPLLNYKNVFSSRLPHD